MRYNFSVVRYVPDPFRGEYVNLGVIVGSVETGEWAVRWATNPQHARRLSGESPKLDAAFAYLHRVDSMIEQHTSALEQLAPGDQLVDFTFDDHWLRSEHQRLRNIVQVTAPTPVVAEGADAAAAMVFDQFVIDEERKTRRTKAVAVNALRTAFRDAALPRGVVHDKGVRGFVGRQQVGIDFAIANGSLVQLVQGWSFAGQDPRVTAQQVKAWSWTVRDIRDGDGAIRVGGGPGGPRSYPVPTDVAIDVLYVPPETETGRESLDEALEVFRTLRVDARDLDAAAEVGQHAATLLRSHSNDESVEASGAER